MSAVASDLRRPGLGLASLGLGAFVVGTAELMVVGVLDLVARDLSVSVSSAGGLVTAYALGISIGGPALTAATIRLARRPLVCAALAAYVAGNVLALAAASFELLLMSRVITGAVHGLFVGLAFALAGGLVPPDREGQAISMVFGGIMVATIAGVPLGTLLGHVATWRAAFGAVVVLGVVALAAVALCLPVVERRGTPDLATQARAAWRPPVIAMLGIALLVMGGQFTALTYLAPYLEEETGISGGAISAFLLVYGLAGAAGTYVGGKAADRSAATTLVLASALLVPVLGLIYLFGTSSTAMALLLAAWAVVGFGLLPSLQLRIITLAGQGGDLAATLGASAANAGIAAGSLAGGAVVAGPGVHYVVVVGAAVCLLTLPATLATRAIGPPAAVGLR